MGLTIAQKIIKDHLLSGEMIPGQEIPFTPADDARAISSP